MGVDFTLAEMEAYLDEGLSAERMAQIEQALRSRPELLQRLAQINARRDSGVHTVGEIWRRHQIGFPTREELELYLSGKLSKEHAAYIRFRVETLQCRYTVANLEDLRAQHREAEPQVGARRKKFFQSSIGRLLD